MDTATCSGHQTLLNGMSFFDIAVKDLALMFQTHIIVLDHNSPRVVVCLMSLLLCCYLNQQGCAIQGIK